MRSPLNFHVGVNCVYLKLPEQWLTAEPLTGHFSEVYTVDYSSVALYRKIVINTVQAGQDGCYLLGLGGLCL